MPIYEYFCERCQSSFEELKSPEQRGAADCPQCSSVSSPILSSFSFRHQTTGQAKFKEGADEKMHYAEKRLADDKSLDPQAWLKQVYEERIHDKDSIKTGKLPAAPVTGFDV